MKRKCRMISMICVIAVVISQLTCNVFWQSEYFVNKASAAEYQSVQGELELGKPLLAELDWQVCREALFEFTPPETDTYVFYSMADDATAANLYAYNEYMVLLASDGMRSGRNENFSLECELTGGKKYYFGALYAESASKVGSFQVVIRKLIKEEEISNQPVLPLSQNGLGYEIHSEGEYVYAQFVPPADGYYNIYTKNACGKTRVCDENCGCALPCDCLSEAALTIYEKDEHGKLNTLYFADAGSSGGTVLYNYFKKDKTYYIEMNAADYKKTGKFKLCADTGLSQAPVDLLEPGKSVERFINGSQDALVYKIVPETTGKYRLSSHGQGLYMTLYNTQMQKLLVTDDYYDGFEEEIQLNEGQSYYIVLRANTLQTYSLSLLLEQMSPSASKEPLETAEPSPSEGPSPSSTPSGTGEPSPSNTPSETGKPSVTDAPSEGEDDKTNISIKNVVVTPVKDQVYTGKALSPVVKLTYRGTVLKVNKDYKVAYKNNKNIGKGTITITGVGAYKDKRTESFNIVPGKVTIKKGKRTAQKRKLSLTWKKVKGATNYEITYSYSSKFKKSKKKTVKRCKVTLKLTSSKKCYVKIRAYKKVGKTKYYGAMSKKKKY